MKKLLVQLAHYNFWANQRMADCVVNLSDEQLKEQVASSFTSIYLTMIHLWDVEAIWWQRMKLADQVIWPGTDFKGSVIDLRAHLLAQSKQWKEWVDLATEPALEHEFIYKNTKKDQFKQPVYEVLLHLFNHQTHHRGQIVTMLHQVGYTKIPNTDLISFTRKK